MSINIFSLLLNFLVFTCLLIKSTSFASSIQNSIKLSSTLSTQRIIFNDFNILKLNNGSNFLISKSNYNLLYLNGMIRLTLFQKDRDLFFEFHKQNVKLFSKRKLIHSLPNKTDLLCNSSTSFNIAEISKQLEQISTTEDLIINCPIENNSEQVYNSLKNSFSEASLNLNLCFKDPNKVNYIESELNKGLESILGPIDMHNRLLHSESKSKIDSKIRAIPQAIECVKLNDSRAQYSKIPPGKILLNTSDIEKLFAGDNKVNSGRFASKKSLQEANKFMDLGASIRHEIIHSLIDFKPLNKVDDQLNKEEGVVNFVDCVCSKMIDSCKLDNFKLVVSSVNSSPEVFAPKSTDASQAAETTANSAEAQANEQVARALSANPEVRAAVVEVSALTANDVFPINAPTSVSPSTRTLPVTDGVERATASADRLVNLVQRALIPAAQAATLNQPQTASAAILSGGAGTASSATVVGSQNSGVKRNVAGVVAAPSGSTNLGAGSDNRVSSTLSSTSGVSKLAPASGSIAGGGLAKLSRETSSSASRGELSAQAATETSVIGGTGGGVLPSSNQARGRISATDSSLTASSASAAVAASSSWAQTQSRIQEAVTYLNAASRIQGTPYKVISSLYNSEASTETREAFSSSLASRSMQIQYSMKQKNQVVGETDLKKMRVLFVDNGSSLEKQNLNKVSELGPILNNTFSATDIPILNQIDSLTNCFLGEKICLDQYFESQSRNIFSFKSKSKLHAKQNISDSNKSLPVLAE